MSDSNNRDSLTSEQWFDDQYVGKTKTKAMTPENEPATDETVNYIEAELLRLLAEHSKEPQTGAAGEVLSLIARVRSEQAERKRLAEIVEKFQVHEYEILYDIIKARKLHDNCKPIDGFLQQMEIGARDAIAASEGKPNPSATAPPPDAGRG